MVPWVSLEYVIVVFPDHTHLLFNIKYKCQKHNQKRVEILNFKREIIASVRFLAQNEERRLKHVRQTRKGTFVGGIMYFKNNS